MKPAGLEAIRLDAIGMAHQPVGFGQEHPLVGLLVLAAGRHVCGFEAMCPNIVIYQVQTVNIWTWLPKIGGAIT